MSQFTINLIWDSSLLAQPNAAAIEASMTSAAQEFASNFSNPLTLNLHVGWGDVHGQAIDAGAVAESHPVLAYRPYAQVAAALLGLPAVNPSTAPTVALTDVEAAAIGLSAATTVDGYIGFSSAFNFYLDQTSNDTVPGYWLVPTFDHEVSEVMGRIAELGQNSQQANSVLDFYRYSAAGVRSFSTSGPAFFFTANGTNRQASFNNDPAGDLGDWYGGGSDPFSAFTNGSKGSLSDADLQAMIVLGWQPTSDTWNAAIFNAMTLQWFGRPLNFGEARNYNFDVAQGQTLGELRQQMLAYAEGVQHTVTTITNLYQTFMGRAPTASEITTWKGLIVAGADFQTAQSAIVTDPAGRAHTDASVAALYETWFGRAPSASELSVWAGLMAGGQNFGALRTALASDPASHPYVDGQITPLYETWFGRDPTRAELSTWEQLIAGGDDFGAARAALVGDPAGQAYIAHKITGMYESVLARDPSAAELATWQGLVAGGDGFADVSAALDRAAVDAIFVANLTPIYETYMGRPPTPADLNGWRPLVAAGETLAAVRAAVIEDRNGQAHLVSEVTSLYQSFFGRSPTADELTVWHGLILHGDDYVAVQAALLADPIGQAHAVAAVTSLYDTLFARDPTAAELGVWHGLLVAGTSLDQVNDTLLRDPGSEAAGIHHPAMLAGQTLTFDPAWTGAAIANFDPSHDVIGLSLAEFGSIRPWEAEQAREIVGLDGSTDVLITLDASHTLLIEHTTRAALNWSDFHFG